LEHMGTTPNHRSQLLTSRSKSLHTQQHHNLIGRSFPNLPDKLHHPYPQEVSSYSFKKPSTLTSSSTSTST